MMDGYEPLSDWMIQIVNLMENMINHYLMLDSMI